MGTRYNLAVREEYLHTVLVRAICKFLHLIPTNRAQDLQNLSRNGDIKQPRIYIDATHIIVQGSFRPLTRLS